LTRWEKITQQINRANEFTTSLRKNGAELLKAVSSAEINLSMVANADSIDVVAAALVQSGNTGCLQHIAALLTEGHELPPPSDVRVRAVLAPDLEGFEMPVQEKSVPVSTPDVETPGFEVSPETQRLLQQLGAK
jgi:hypothetical protein